MPTSATWKGYVMGPTPCGVMYQTISALAGNRRYEDIDACIISRDPFDSKNRSPYDRINATVTFRTREIIQKNPAALDTRVFRTLPNPALDVIAYLRRMGNNDSAIVGYIASEASANMVASLTEYGFDHHIYLNMLNDILRNNPDNTNTTVAVMVLFLATGFYSNPKLAATVYHSAIRQYGAKVDMGTSLLDSEDNVLKPTPAPMQSIPYLALTRLYPDGSLDPAIHYLNAQPEGTIIGRTVTDPLAINNVGATVSRQHLRIYQSNGTWYAVGMGSTNGTWIIKNGGQIVTVEPPKKSRVNQVEPVPVCISPNDVLKLGSDTHFKVVTVRR